MKALALALSIFLGSGSVLANDNDLCSKEKSDIRGLVTQYSNAVLGPNGLPAGKPIVSAIQTRLLEIESSRSSCLTAAGTEYVRDSLNLLENFVADSSLNGSLSNLAEKLSSQGHLSFLTEKSRNDSKVPLFKSSRWGTYTAVGAFACEAHKIFVDITKPPLNVAAIFAHESVHMNNDSLLHFDHNYLLADAVNDELVAILYEGSLQRNFWRNALRSGNLGHFQKDLTRFTPDGDLDKLWIYLGATDTSDFFGKIRELVAQRFDQDTHDQRVARSKLASLVNRITPSYANRADSEDKNSWHLYDDYSVPSRGPAPNIAVFDVDALVSISGVSNACQSFNEAFDIGLLFRYRGTIYLEGDSGVRPADGDHGVRPAHGDSGVRPCLEIQP
jgi:hypothetical protein